jgi:potassium efflux system protein
MLVLALATWVGVVSAQITNVPSTDALQDRIATAKDSTELDEAARTRLIDLYRQTIANLEAIRQNEEATEDYKAARAKAPKEAERIRAQVETKRQTSPTAGLGITAQT